MASDGPLQAEATQRVALLTAVLSPCKPPASQVLTFAASPCAMPYYYREWNVAIGEPAVKSGRTLRKIPSGEQPPPEQTSSSPVGTVDANVLAQIREALKTHVDDLKATKCATPIKDSDTFLNYLIQKDMAIFEGKYSSIYSCFNHHFREMPLVCRIFQPTAMIAAENDLFLKVLRKLGQSHTSIIATVDIFNDEGGRIYVIQEYANCGNAYDYIKSCKKVVTEKMAQGWANSIYNALDYIGTIGICHRSIEPKHIRLLTAPGDQVVAKLGSFRDAVIYYDVVTHDIIDQPCKPVAKRYAFQAPEVFGEPNEFYNPAVADIWSFGATLLFLAGHIFAYSVQSPVKNLDETIKNNIANVAHLSDAAKACFYGMMRCNTELRVRFEAIPADPWMQGKSA